jgi:hypothetical protein
MRTAGWVHRSAFWIRPPAAANSNYMPPWSKAARSRSWGLTRIYLRTPALWPLLGKQFLVLARK